MKVASDTLYVQFHLKEVTYEGESYWDIILEFLNLPNYYNLNTALMLFAISLFLI